MERGDEKIVDDEHGDRRHTDGKVAAEQLKGPKTDDKENNDDLNDGGGFFHDSRWRSRCIFIPFGSPE